MLFGLSEIFFDSTRSDPEGFLLHRKYGVISHVTKKAIPDSKTRNRFFPSRPVTTESQADIRI